MNVMQLGLLGIVGAIFALQLKSLKEEYSIVICIGLSLIIFFSVVARLEEVIGTIREVVDLIALDSAYVRIILKMLGITYVAEFSSAICKDAGYQTIASQIEIVAKLSMLVMSLPIILALLKTIQGFLR